ncbi:hypothetical protein, partial [Streptomyces sp. NPDC051098]|uniref:hypothetical protein n=1 Tax=Streptomyces sp. NPDC051098 TaxID=3155411 RepID=UPI00343408E8
VSADAIAIDDFYRHLTSWPAEQGVGAQVLIVQRDGPPHPRPGAGPAHHDDLESASLQTTTLITITELSPSRTHKAP